MRDKGDYGVMKVSRRWGWTRRRRGNAWRPGVLIAVALLAVSGSAWGQCSPPSMNLFFDDDIQVFRVGDFDPSDAGYHPHIFTLRIMTDCDHSVTLRFQVDTPFGQLAEGETSPFVLSAGVPYTITNGDLADEGSVYELQDLSIDTDVAETMGNSILGTGYLPEGIYTFILTLRSDVYPGEFADVVSRHMLQVVNPLTLELLRPGASFGGFVPIVLSGYPQFQWSSRAERWLFEIAQALPGDASGEDVMEHMPVYQVELSCGDPDPERAVDCGTLTMGGFASGAVNWSYPSSAEDLGRGRTYCWRVTALVETSGGTEEISSDVFCFRRWGVEDLMSQPVAEALAEIMPDLLDRLGPELEGMMPTGTVIVDGEAVDPVVVQDILERIASGELQVIGVEIR